MHLKELAAETEENHKIPSCIFRCWLDKKSERYVVLAIVCLAILEDMLTYMSSVPFLSIYVIDASDKNRSEWSTVVFNETLSSDAGHNSSDPVESSWTSNNSGFLLGVLFASKMAVAAVTYPLAGHIVDRCGPSRPFLGGLLIITASLAAFATASDYVTLLIARCISGIGAAFQLTGGFMLIARQFADDKAHVQRASALAMWFTCTSSIIGPPIGGSLYAAAGEKALVYVLFVLLSTNLLCLLVVLSCRKRYSPGSAWWQLTDNDGPLPPPATTNEIVDTDLNVQGSSKQPPASNESTCLTSPPSTSVGSSAENLVEQSSLGNTTTTTMWQLASDPYVLLSSGVRIHLPVIFIDPTLPLWMSTNLAAQPWQIGMVWLTGLLPYVVSGLIAGKALQVYADCPWLLSFIGMAVQGAGCMSVAFCQTYYDVIGPIVVVCFGYGLCDTAVLPLLYRIVDLRHDGPASYGKVVGLTSSAITLSAAVVPPIGSYLSQLIGFTNFSLVIGIAVLVYSPCLICVRNVGR